MDYFILIIFKTTRKTRNSLIQLQAQIPGAIKWKCPVVISRTSFAD